MTLLERILNYHRVTGFPKCLFIGGDGRIVGTRLDQVLPMYRKDQFCVEGVIGMVKSTNHRFRVMTIFKKL